MAKRKTFPHIETNVQDNSGRTVLILDTIPLHVPIFFLFTEKGKPNVPFWGTYDQQALNFGDSTFDPKSKFFNHQTIFAKKASSMQSYYVVRLLPADATSGGLVLEAKVKQTAITQYEKDNLGNIVLDESGNPKPRVAADGTSVVTEPGISLTWSTRPLLATEVYNHLAPSTQTVNGVSVTTYPVLVIKASDPGAYSNYAGFRLYFDPDYDASAVNNIDGLLYQFEPVKLDPDTAVVSPIRDIYSSAGNPVSLAYDAYDASTDIYYDLTEIVANRYADPDSSPTDPRSLIPFNIFVYNDNVKTIGTAVLAVSPELGSISPDRINIVSGVQPDETLSPYDHFVVDGSTVLNANVNLFSVGGADGTITNASYEALLSSYMTGDIYPDIGDNSRYPITHIYDSGFTLKTKKDLLKIWTLRDDVKIEFSTQDLQNNWNSKAEDQSTGAALRAEALLHPESTKYGTPVVRASIYQQCGYLNDSTLSKFTVTANLDRMMKRCVYDGTENIRGTPKGRPNSEVSIFRQLSWTPSTADHRQLSWDNGLNYAEYCDQTTLFYADLRSVYPDDTSLLSSDTVADKIVYTKNIARKWWTVYAGREDDVSKLYDQIASRIASDINTKFAGQMDASVEVYQTAEDEALGYKTTIKIHLKGTPAQRVWDVIVSVERRSGSK